jgi:hypothetical protein
MVEVPSRDIDQSLIVVVDYSQQQIDSKVRKRHCHQLFTSYDDGFLNFQKDKNSDGESFRY